jgi:uncharacterized protein YbjT (DUF2867 family)
MTKKKLALVTGATGYIGGRLVPRLLAEGYAVRVLVRSPAKLRAVPWFDQVDVVEGDLSDVDSTASACEGVHTFFYLVHSMGSGTGFEQTELRMAETITQAADRA